MNSSLRSRLWQSLAICACLSGCATGALAATISESEPNGSSATADALLFGTNPVAVATGAIASVGDTDYFSFSAQAGARVWIYVDTGGTATGASRNSLLRLVSGDGISLLELDDDDGSGNGLDGTSESAEASAISGFLIPTSGTYYVLVSESGGDATLDPYTLYLALSSQTGAEMEPNNSSGQSNSLAPDLGMFLGWVTMRSATLATGSDQDWYYFNAVAGQIVYVMLDGNPERDGTNLDADLALFGPGLSLLYEADSDDGTPLGEAFAYQVPTAGRYYVRVRDIGGSDSGTYLVTMARVDGNACLGAGKGNFDNKFGADLLFREVSTNRNKVWLMNGATQLSETFISPDPASNAQRVVGADDFGSNLLNSPIDGQTDLVLYDIETGGVEFWLMNGTTRLGAAVPLTGAAPLPLEWKLSATGDFNQDGHPDLVWRNFNTQKIVVWRMGEGGPPALGTQYTSSVTPTPDQAVNSNWEIVAALDLNNNNQRDFLWYNYSSGKIVTWYMDSNLVRTSGQFTVPDSAGNNNWKVYAGGDYSWNYSPGTPPYCSTDLVWRNQTSGKSVVWHMDTASTRVHGAFTTPDSNTTPLDWELVGPR